jgi:hypothetical protein
MSLKLRDRNNKYIMDFDESSKSINVTEFEPTTFNMRDGEYNYEPIATYEYSSNSLNGQPIHGSWYDTTNQYSPVSGTATAMLCNSGSGNGISKVSNKQFKVQYRGTYNLQFSAQIDQESGGGRHIIIWFRKNGVNVPYSSSEVAIQGTTAESVPSWNFIFDLEIDDYVEIMYSVTNTSVFLKSQAPTSVVPGIPSVIVTMWKL